jgi:transaldolase
VNPAARQLGDEILLGEAMAAVVGAAGAATEILAASSSDPAEVVGARQAGAHDVTISVDRLEALGDQPLSKQAIEESARFSRVEPNPGLRGSR